MQVIYVSNSSVDMKLSLPMNEQKVVNNVLRILSGFVLFTIECGIYRWIDIYNIYVIPSSFSFSQKRLSGFAELTQGAIVFVSYLFLYYQVFTLFIYHM